MYSRKIASSMTARGLTFGRRQDGAVVVSIGPAELAIIPANEWASVTANLSPEGETGTTFRFALTLITGGSVYDPAAHEHATECS